MASWLERALCALVFTAQVLTFALCQPCPQSCRCPSEPPRCPPGVRPQLDGCGCCLVCGRQRGQSCSVLSPCDGRRGLRCRYPADGQQRVGLCVADQGPVCVLDGAVYRSGQTFFPSCKYQCVCREGQVACIPRCQLDVMLPGPDCPAPRRVQTPGACCDTWLCEPPAEASALGGFAMAAYRQEETVSFDHWDPSLNCIEQTTEWGACSQSCGVGVSTRVTNKNRRCELVKQSRLCLIRPCQDPTGHLAPKRGSKCQKTARSPSALHLSYKSCTSVQAYKPRYCGSCTDGRCCTPHRTKTALLDFSCPGGKTTKRAVMVVLTCACHSHCPQHNAAWLPAEGGQGAPAF